MITDQDGNTDDKDITATSDLDDHQELQNAVATPSDPFRVVYLMMVVMGIGILTPFNSVISAGDYYDHVMPHYEVLLYFSLAYNMPSIPTLLMMIMYGDKVSFGIRILTSLLFCGMLLALLPFIPIFCGQNGSPDSISTNLTTMIVDLDSYGVQPGPPSSEVFSFYISLVLVFFLGVSTNVLQSSLFGFAGQLPPLYTQALMGGNGVAGVLVCVIRVITKAGTQCRGSSASHTLSDSAIRTSAIIYFVSGSGILVLCCVCYVLVVNMQFTKYYVDENSQEDSDAQKKSADYLPVSKSSKSPRLTSSQSSPLLKDLQSAPLLEHENQQKNKRKSPTRKTRYRVGVRTQALSGISLTSSSLANVADEESRPNSKSYVEPSSRSSNPIITSRTIRIAREKRSNSAGESEKMTYLERISLPLFVANLPVNSPRSTDVESNSAVLGDVDATAQMSGLQKRMNIFKKIWMLAIQVALSFGLTLNLFPQEVALVPFKHSADSQWLDDALRPCGSQDAESTEILNEWWGIILFLVFNTFDFTGRMLAGFNSGWKARSRLLFERCMWICTLARWVIFIPLILFATTGEKLDNYIMVCTVVALGLSNGYAGSVFMMFGPMKVSQENREMAGFMMSTFLQIGILCGTLIAMAWGPVLSAFK